MDVVELASRSYGEPGRPVIVMLHGLLGDASNLASVAKSLETKYQVFSLDLRNHGASGHSEQMDIPLMAGDVYHWLQENQVDSPVLFGHSLGGKVAMQLALEHPEEIRALIIEDISPAAYPANHLEILDALQSLDLESLESRSNADSQLQVSIKEPGLRSFLLKNLTVEKGSSPRRFYWRCNLPALAKNYDSLRESVSLEATFQKPTLFIKGELSSYLQEQHRSLILELFPQAQLKVVAGAGHWAHSEKPAALQALVTGFLSNI